MTVPTLSLMVVPNGADIDAMPQILVDHCGVWRDLSSTAHRASQVISKINENLKGLAQLIGQRPLPANHMIISNMFNDFFELIVPAKVRELLTKTLHAAAPNETPLLRIHTHSSNEWIPWEILRDGTDLLGLRFRIARLPIVPHILDATDDKPHSVQSISNFLGRDVLDNSQREAWENTFNGLINPGFVQNLPPPGNSANYPDLQRISEHYQNADILHVMCHGMKDPKENVYLTLDHRSTPETSILYNITTTSLNGFVFSKRPLVFGNGCSSAGGVAGPNQIPGGLMPPGIGASFFSRGALNFVGTFAPVTKTMALQFARKFYEHLLLGENGVSGSPVAEALWATKNHFQKAGADDPSYLFYCLYGPAETTYRTE